MVKEGTHKETGAKVAIKFVNTAMFSKSSECLKETVKEIQALRQVRAMLVPGMRLVRHLTLPATD